MNVWLITIGEPLPIDKGNQRLLRAGLLAEMLSSRGARVTWWTSTFEHWQKTHRVATDRTVQVGTNYDIRLLRGFGYSSNVSLARLLDHHRLGRKFRRAADAARDLPDIILASFPSIELCAEAVRFGRAHDIPVVLDIRDLWPDIFVKLAPRGLEGLARLALAPYHSMTRTAMRGATAIFGINELFVEWGLRSAERARSIYDRVFPLAYPDRAPSEKDRQAAEAFWRQKGIGPEKDRLTLAFAGTIGRQFEFEPVIEAAKQLPDVRFVICGTGDRFDYVSSLVRGLGNVVMTGWVGASEIWTLLRCADAGLAPYHSEESFTASLPNKSLEYLSAGLPIVSSLPGALERLLQAEGCGLTYRNNDSVDLVGALSQLRANPALRREMSGNAIRLYNERFRAETVYGDMIRCLEQLALSS